MNTPLQKAAKALIETWDRSSYIGEEIAELRKSLDAELVPLYLHPPQPQATTPALRECWYESNELKVCLKCGQMHDKAIAAQGEKT